MSAFVEISEKFIKVVEEFMPELKSRIVIYGQSWGEPKDGKPYVIISMLDSPLSNFTDSNNQKDEWARTFKIELHVYGRNLDTLDIAEKLAFINEKTMNINKFLKNGIGVFCNRKIKPRPETEGSTVIYRYDLEFALTFIGRSEPSRSEFEQSGELAALTTER